jgi:hypothetical protein
MQRSYTLPLNVYASVWVGTDLWFQAHDGLHRLRRGRCARMLALPGPVWCRLFATPRHVLLLVGSPHIRHAYLLDRKGALLFSEEYSRNKFMQLTQDGLVVQRGQTLFFYPGGRCEEVSGDLAHYTGWHLVRNRCMNAVPPHPVLWLHVIGDLERAKGPFAAWHAGALRYIDPPEWKVKGPFVEWHAGALRYIDRPEREPTGDRVFHPSGLYCVEGRDVLISYAFRTMRLAMRRVGLVSELRTMVLDCM